MSFKFLSKKFILLLLFSFITVICYQNCRPIGVASSNYDEAGNLDINSSPVISGPTPTTNKLCKTGDSLNKSSSRRLSRDEINTSVMDLIGESVDLKSLPAESSNKYFFSRDGATQSLSEKGAEKIYNTLEISISKFVSKNSGALMNCSNLSGTVLITCLDKELIPLVYRAWRRPVSPTQKAKIYKFFNGVDFDKGIHSALLYTFLSPKFLYVSFDSGPTATRLNSFEVAERLTFLIWGTVPDIEVLDQAKNNELSSLDSLKNLAIALLNNRTKSKKFFETFTKEWLSLDELDHAQRTDKKFTPSLAKSLSLEVAHHFEELFRKNRPIKELLTSNFSIMSRDVADLYNVDWDAAPAWDIDRSGKYKKVQLSGNRNGLLTLAGVLTANAMSKSQASATQRGYWTTKRIICKKPGDIPDDVSLEVKPIQASARKQLENHVKSAACQKCHSLMDPIGFGFGNFDALGQYISKDGFNYDVDASGTILNKNFSNAPEMVDVFAEAQEVENCFSNFFTTYITTKVSEVEKSCTQKNILTNVKNKSGGLQDYLLDVITSKLFLTKVN